MVKRILLGTALVLGGLIAPAQTAQAQLRITVTDANTEPMPIAIPDFQAAPELSEAAASIAEVIRNDLESSGLFRSIDPDAFIQRDLNIDYQPAFADWRVIKADALVTGRLTQTAPDRLLVEFRLWDVFAGKQMTGLRFATTPDNWRRMSHKIADAVYTALTAEDGYFDSRIVYVSETGPKTNRTKRLAIMDQDGANKQTLMAGPDRILFPRFDPTSQTITYMSYEPGRTKIYLYDISTGRRELLGDFPGLMFAARFSDDGKKLAMSMDQNGNSDIYLMDVTTRSTQRLTSDPNIDISASFEPEGRAIAFLSDRGGSKQIYVMNPDGSDVKRISRGDHEYNSPVWSPRGDKIAFIREKDGKYGVGIMDTDGSNERILSESWMEDSPTWSPNGRVIMFNRETRGSGLSELYSVDITGRNLRKIDMPHGASDPAWSPQLDDSRE